MPLRADEQTVLRRLASAAMAEYFEAHPDEPSPDFVALLSYLQELLGEQLAYRA